jgi:hypothetical protein
MPSVKKFQRGNSTFTCGLCDRRTRVTNNDHEHSGNCAECYELSGLENAVFDGAFTKEHEADRATYLKAIVKKGGNEEKVRSVFQELFAAVGAA